MSGLLAPTFQMNLQNRQKSSTVYVRWARILVLAVIGGLA